jgi:RNA polymerase sigma-70 factor (ECF subfamily)
MVSVLTRIFGTSNLELAEDVVQDTLLKAFEAWSINGIPDNPSAWLYRVARNEAITIIRKNKHSIHYDFTESKITLLLSEVPESSIDPLWKEEAVKDDMLRMMFACCHPEISAENQIILILKLLCGFSTAEIAKAFLLPDDTVSKRLYRTKELFRNHQASLSIPSPAELKSRTDAVLNAIYLLFNEGYNATQAEQHIRKDLMEEAMLLCRLLIENEYTCIAETYALMALMCFHASRSNTRLSTTGEIILLSEQNRSQWDTRLIDAGNWNMHLASQSELISAYHIEAAIAYEYCCADSFDKTNWDKIVQYYQWLSNISYSPFTLLNMAVAMMYAEGPEAALNILCHIPDKERMENFYLYHAVLGEIYLKLNNIPEARLHLKKSISLTKSDAEKKLLQEKIERL